MRGAIAELQKSGRIPSSLTTSHDNSSFLDDSEEIECCLLMRPLDSRETAELRKVRIPVVKLYCGVSTQPGFPVRIVPSHLAGKTVLERLLDYFHVSVNEADRGAQQSGEELLKHCVERCVAWRDGWRGLSDLETKIKNAATIIEGVGIRSLPYRADDNSRLALTELEIELRYGKPEGPTTIEPPTDTQDSSSPVPSGQIKPLLVFYHHRESTQADAEPGLPVHDIDAIELSGPVRLKEWCLELMADPLHCQRHRMHFSHGDHLLRFIIEPVGPCHIGQTDRLVSELLEVLLGASRPLRYYTATIYLPLPWPNRKKRYRISEEARPITSEKEIHKAISQLTSLYNKSEKTLDKPIDGKAANAQAMLYFSPAVRAQAFDSGDKTDVEKVEPIRCYQYNGEGKDKDLYLAADMRALDQSSQNTGLPSSCLKARISNLSLFQHPADTDILAITVQFHPACSSLSWALSDEKHTPGLPWWGDLLNSDRWKEARECQLDAWLVFTRAVRYLYRSFREEDREAGDEPPKILPIQLYNGEKALGSIGFKDGTKECDTFNASLFWLLGKFLVREENNETAASDEKPNEKELFDHFSKEFESDRLYVNAAYALAGPAPASATTRDQTLRLFSLALYVDTGFDSFAAAEGYTYDPDFLERQMENNRYGRWEAVGTWIGHTDNASVYLGFGDTFIKPIAILHVPWIYGRFVLLALFHHHILRQLQRRAQRLPVDYTKGDRDDDLQGDWERLKQLKKGLKSLRKNFIDFTNLYWIHFPTEQIQGKEMYDRLAKVLDLEKTHALAQQKIEQAESFVSREYQDILAGIAREIGYISFFLTLMGIIFTILHSKIAHAFLDPIFYNCVFPHLNGLTESQRHFTGVVLETIVAFMLTIPTILLLRRFKHLRLIGRPMLGAIRRLLPTTILTICVIGLLYLAGGLVN